MVRIALDRKIPPHPIGAERRIAAGCTNKDLLVQLRQAGCRLAVQKHTLIRTKSRDGTLLLGHWFPAENPKRIIIAMHGWRSAWDNDFGIVADFFHENNCSVLYAEQRGQGGSGGECMGFGLTERYDCLDWIHWVNKHTGGNLPIYLCGVSMGASTVLMATDLPLPENVRGVVADCGFTSPVDIWKHVARQAHLAYGVCGGPIGRIAKKRLQMAADATSCPQALAKSKIPVLFVHGTDDRFVPIEMTYANFKACAAPKRLFIVPGAEHGMSYLVDPAGYQAAIRDFWHTFDKK
jgi:fermentation-respiration switch protein FrsA (DUF1100 family)